MMTDTDFDSSRAILALVLSADGTLFAASSAGLRARRLDERDWRQVLPPSGIAPFPVTALAMTAKRRLLAGIPGGIGYSDNDGESWTFTALPLPAPVITKIAIDPNNDQLIFAGTEADGVFRSEDGGDTWSAWNFGLLDTTVTTIAITRSNGVLAGTSTGLFRSANLGKSWTPAPAFAENMEIFAILERDAQTFIATSVFSMAVKLGGLDGPTMFVRSLHGHRVHAIEPGPGEVLAALVDNAVWVSFDEGFSWDPIDSETNERITTISGFIETESEYGLFTGSADGSVLFMAISEIAPTSNEE
jgi:photosystem II stability/assembly factor-like uncharacterized protein